MTSISTRLSLSLSLILVALLAAACMSDDSSTNNSVRRAGAGQHPPQAIGVYRPSDSTFYLRNTNAAGAPDFTIPFGMAGDVPVVGAWSGQ
jgi:hypothetical protein